MQGFVLFGPYIGPYQVLPHRARVDQAAMAINRYSAFPKIPVFLEPHYQTALLHTPGSLPLCCDAGPANWSIKNIGYNLSIF